jgi:hypothetical protein
MARKKEAEGPRGGSSTRTRGQTKKVFWLDDEIVEALRTRAFEERTSEVAIVREALRAHLELK